MDESTKKNKGFRTFAQKGLYVALALAVVAIGGLATVGLTGERQESTPTPTTTAANQAVEQKVTNIPDTRTTATTRATTTAKKTTATAPPAEEPLMVLPMGNRLLQGFSNGKAVYSETMADFRPHNGADFAGESGAKVAAVSAGKVKSVTEDALWGPMLVIDHGQGITSTYCGVTASVKVGDEVKVGQTIGALSDIPCELMGGPHLHLELAVNGKTMDPVASIGKEVAPVTVATTTATTKG